jgi:hypothetical protein
MTLLTTLLAAETKFKVSAPGQFTNLNGITLPNMISVLITLVLIVAAIVFFFMLIIGGIKWILAGGDKAQTESARNTVTSALIGLVVVFSAWAIANLLSALFDIQIFNLNLPSFTTGTGSSVPAGAGPGPY